MGFFSTSTHGPNGFLPGSDGDGYRTLCDTAQNVVVLDAGEPHSAAAGRRQGNGSVPLNRRDISAIGLMRLLLGASVLVPVALFAFAGWMNYKGIVAQARRDLDRTSQIAEEHAAKVLDAQRQVVERVGDLVRGMDATTVEANEKRLHEALGPVVAGLPQVESVLLVSRTGRPLVSAGIYPVPGDVDLRQMDYFKAVMAGGTSPYVSSLQIGGVNHQLFFGLASPWKDASGQTNGVIDIALSPSFFQEFYADLIREDDDGMKGKVLTLVRADGEMLVRYPPLVNLHTRVPAANPFRVAIASDPEHGGFDNTSIVDSPAPQRIYAYWKVPGYPVYVVAGRSWSVIMQEWRATLVSHVIFAVPATLALFGLTWLAFLRTRREEHALALARSEMRRREQAEDALLRAQRLEAVGQMTGGVAHDFNNLLTIIAGSVEMMERKPADADRVLRLAGNIRLAARRGAEITQKLLSFSMRQVLKPETVDLNRRLREFRALLDRAASEAVTLEFDLDPSLRPVRLDPGHFEAAMLNLVGNARDAMSAGGRITIRTRNVTLTRADADGLTAGAYALVSVADNGTGMDEATATRAFEPFFTTKDVGRGTGLGLSQVYGFARQAGGDIRLKTRLGAGTTIELFLPHSAEPLPAAERGAADGPSCPPAGQVVLVVEDEPGVREIAVQSLAELGYATITAADGPEALQRLHESDRIDLLFSDIVMPGGMSGLELAEQARRMRPELKVLLTSGYATVTGDRLPPDVQLLPKPYSRAELAAHLQAAVGVATAG